MAKVRTFDRLPECWKRADQPRESNGRPSMVGSVRVKGVLERFLDVWDVGLDEAHTLATALLDLHNVEMLPDRFLRLLSQLVGYDWDESHDYVWNRTRLQHAITRHSERGSQTLLGRIVEDNGGGVWAVLDMASTIFVFGKEGQGWSQGFFRAPDFRADGAFLLTIDDDLVDIDSLKIDLGDTLAKGTRWFYRLNNAGAVIFEWIINSDSDSQQLGLSVSTNTDEYMIGEGAWDEDLWYGTPPGYSLIKHAPFGPGVIGGYVDLDSTISLDNSGVTLSMGTAKYPLPGAVAVQQGASLIT